MTTLATVDLRLLDSDVGRRDLAQAIEKALSSSGAFYVIGIEGYNEQELLTWNQWFFALPEKQKKKLIPENEGRNLHGYFVDHPHIPHRKEGYQVRPKISNIDGIWHHEFDSTPWPECEEFRCVLQQNHASFVKTAKLLVTLILEIAGLDDTVAHAVAQSIGGHGLRLIHQMAQSDGFADQIDFHPDLYDDPGFIYLCSTFSQPSVQLLPPEAKVWTEVQPVENSLMVCIGPALAALTLGKFHPTPHRHVSKINSCITEMGWTPKFFQPIMIDIHASPRNFSHHLTFGSDGDIRKPRNNTASPDDLSALEKDLSSYLITPAHENRDLTDFDFTQSCLSISKKRRLSVISVELKETFWSMFTQVLFPFFMAGFGMVGAGLVLDIVQHWEVFENIGTFFIMVPALLGLKGNLEMTLASRVSTLANLGHMDEPGEMLLLVKTNLALVQVQAIVVGLLASIVAIIMGFATSDPLTVEHCALLCASAIATASAASLILGSIMMIVIAISHRLKINPDNIATPIAASLGDLTTLGLLTVFSTLLYHTIESYSWVLPLVIILFLSMIPLFAWIAKGHAQTRQVLKTGWLPILGAMMISSGGGMILDRLVHEFAAFAAFQPVINGVGGNLVAVQASRISTWLHRHAVFGQVPERTGPICATPVEVFIKSGPQTMSARVLLLLVIPGQVIFSLAIKFFRTDGLDVSYEFIGFYVLVSFLQVLILLYVANGLVLVLWRKRIDPDNAAIPFMTAFGDLIGSGFLAVAFFVVQVMNAEVLSEDGLFTNVTNSSIFNQTVPLSV